MAAGTNPAAVATPEPLDEPPGRPLEEVRQVSGGDFDGDGVNDFILSFRQKPPALVWYRRQAAGWDAYVIEKDYLTIEAGGAACDIDGDGRAELFAADRCGSCTRCDTCLVYCPDGVIRRHADLQAQPMVERRRRQLDPAVHPVSDRAARGLAGVQDSLPV